MSRKGILPARELSLPLISEDSQHTEGSKRRRLSSNEESSVAIFARRFCRMNRRCEGRKTANILHNRLRHFTFLP